jgi:hypothetical protein
VPDRILCVRATSTVQANNQSDFVENRGGNKHWGDRILEGLRILRV